MTEEEEDEDNEVDDNLVENLPPIKTENPHRRLKF